MTEQEKQKCSICPNPSSYKRTDCLGFVHRACTSHEKYLEGWVQDVRAENAAANRAAGSDERRAHGDD